ncbi:MAG: hypothetical protein EZS28_056157, partial [Streblomastix strix]
NGVSSKYGVDISDINWESMQFCAIVGGVGSFVEVVSF